jgi:hypothetical protein
MAAGKNIKQYYQRLPRSEGIVSIFSFLTTTSTYETEPLFIASSVHALLSFTFWAD